VVQASEGGEAQVFLQGSWWAARPRRGTLRPGQRVRVVEMDGLRLIVEPEEEAAEGAKEGER
jgi:membrane protein implicated in regulation of membrane protease activity